MSDYRRTTHVLLPVLMIGLGLRALIPAGYMPGSIDGGPWFVLCGDSVPISMTMPASEAGDHHHHHDEASETSSLSGDCSFGHLLAGAVLTADIDQATIRRFDDRFFAVVRDGVVPHLRLRNPNTRAPPRAS